MPGTSPRARGRPAGPARGPGGGGNIPACAGPTRHQVCVHVPGGEHPRVRGADSHPGIGPPAHPGTSPRARGRPEVLVDAGRQARNIPACAGPTSLAREGSRRAREHPRVRGADDFQGLHLALSNGTSPRARGRPRVRCRRRWGPGNIPACAGPTSASSCRVTRRREHPRVRGADSLPVPATPRPHGTSPRARGRPPSWSGGRRPRRNIPACAGPTSTPRRGTGTAGEHPRVRGADYKHRVLYLNSMGTSPRARGRHFFTCGFIVARCCFRLVGQRVGAASSTCAPLRRAAVVNALERLNDTAVVWCGCSVGGGL